MQLSGLQGFGGTVSFSNSSASSSVSFGAVLAGLITAVKGGDSETAQKYLGMAQSATGGLAANSTLGQFLTQVGKALSNGDISAAQDAVATLQSKAAKVTPASDPVPSSSQVDGSVLSSAGSHMAHLFDAMNSGDLTGAQSAYSALKSLVAKSPEESSPVTQRMQNLLAEIGPSLDSGNMAAAQQSLNGFLRGLSAGSMVNINA